MRSKYSNVQHLFRSSDHLTREAIALHPVEGNRGIELEARSHSCLEILENDFGNVRQGKMHGLGYADPHDFRKFCAGVHDVPGRVRDRARVDREEAGIEASPTAGWSDCTSDEAQPRQIGEEPVPVEVAPWPARRRRSALDTPSENDAGFFERFTD